MKILDNKRKKLLFIAGVVVVLALLAVIKDSVSGMKEYDELLVAEVMNVYDGDSLICSFPNPQQIMDTYNGSVGVGVVDISQHGLNKSDLEKLYTFEFVKNSKTIGSIEMFALRESDEIDEQSATDVFRKYNGKYVVMHETGNYFLFGERFYDCLSELIT